MASTAGAAILNQIEPRESLDAWKLAKARFLDGLNESEKIMFHGATIENLFYGASDVERKDREESKTRAVVETIQPFISAIEEYGKAMDTYANIASLYLAPIWGSIRVLLAMANGYSKFYSRIMDTFSRIGDILPRFRDYQRIFDGQKHLRFTHALSMAYLDIILLCTEFKSLLRIQRRSSVRRLFQPLSPALNSHLDDAIVRFREHRKAVDKEAAICHMIEEKESRDLVLRNNEAAEARNRQAKQRALISHLRKVDYEYKHNRMQKIRHFGTGTWFKDTDEFKSWLACDTSAVICCYGIPGCGKSVLTSSLVDSTKTMEPEKTVVSFYCDHSDKRTLDPVNVFSCISHQLLRDLHDLSPNLFKILEDICQEGKTAELEDMMLLILEAMKKHPSVIIFIDGLDEVLERERKLVFSSIRHLIKVLPSSIKFFIASREDTGYLTKMTNLLSFKVHMRTSVIAGDIDSFVRHTVQDLIDRGELVLGSPLLEDEIATALAQGAKGMFLWVKFQLDDLCACECDDAIKNVLRNLPRDLSETYDRLLNRVDGVGRQEYVRRMFRWIICARRPLKVDEVREAIAFTIDDNLFDAAKVPNDLHRLARACGNLVVIDEETENVQLAHYTVEQYLLGQQRTIPSPFQITREEANFLVGELCVAYLSFTDFESQIVKRVDEVTPNFGVAENIVSKHSFLPPNTAGASLANALMNLRRARHTSTGIEYAKHITIRNRSSTIHPGSKYCLLSYIVENWLYHTVEFSNQVPSNTTSPKNHEAIVECYQLRLFDGLAFDKSLLFDIRPWDSVVINHKDLSYIAQIEWAISNNHLVLARAIHRRSETEISLCLDLLTGWVFRSFIGQPVKHIPEALFDKLYRDENASEPSLSSGLWESWLHHRLIDVCSGVKADALAFCFRLWKPEDWSTRSALFGYLLLRAVRHGDELVAKILCKNISSWRLRMKSAVWITTTSDGLTCNAYELASLCGSETLMDLVASAGCTVSSAFKMNAAHIRNVIDGGEISKIRSLLKIFGATDPYLLNIESGLYNSREGTTENLFGPSKNSYALSSAINENSIELYPGTGTEAHWIWAVPGHQDRIDLLLSIGTKPVPGDENWLVRDAILGDRRGRIHLLLQGGVTFSPVGQSYVTSNDCPANVLVNLSISADLTTATIPPLSVAVSNRRTQIVRELLEVSAPVDERDPKFGFTPLHYAVAAGSVELFKMLHQNGARLEIKDPLNRNIIRFAHEVCESNEAKWAITRYVMSKNPDLDFEVRRAACQIPALDGKSVSRPRPPRPDPWRPVYQPHPPGVEEEVELVQILDEEETTVGFGAQVLISHNF